MVSLAVCSNSKCSRKLRMTEDIMNDHLLHQLIGNNWRELARQLKFTQAVIGTIKSDCGSSTNECCIAVIVRWINQEGEDATVGRLAEALIKIGLKTVAEKLLNSLYSPVKEEPGVNASDQIENRINEMEKNWELLKIELQDRIQQLEKENESITQRNLELEEELAIVKQKLQDTSNAQEDLEYKFDVSHRENDSEDTRADAEREVDEKLKDLNEQLYIKVTSPLQVPEVKEDKLRVSVTIDLLFRISVSLQELYSSVLSMAAETCKCSEKVKQEFHDFAYHGIRAEHNDLVHRVEDLATAREKMSDEEKKDFGKLQQLQTNRQREVDKLENLWRGLFSPPEGLPPSCHSAPCPTCHCNKDLLRRKRTDPGVKPKQVRPGEHNTSPVTETMSEDEKFEVCFTKFNCKKTTMKTIFKKRESKEKTCCHISYSSKSHRDS
ncbi:uncharacterized protein LOC111330979 isoform X2 [Stylophora pistillata]|uniref:uncharacterized protein LOC111330979 isoform X2 n=1 Tax=Stylophora pistillata TaxID=50429 RepID=UPI000C056AC5|nr:uncharacterized protein LOC111330979 isoform X2 [Stylophora pistillata]